MNDINGFHVTKEHAFRALDGAKPGPVAEGNVGGGTGMVARGFKGGTGTSSRVLAAAEGGYTVGVLVQANYGRRDLLRATVEATEEAIVNAMVAAKRMRGIDGHTVHALPHERLREVLRRYNRLAK